MTQYVAPSSSPVYNMQITRLSRILEPLRMEIDKKLQSIYIENCLFYVIRTCKAALRRLRLHQVRRLWMDALFINKANVNERNHQVGLMDMIYQQAVRVHTSIQDPLHDHSRCVRWLNTEEGYRVWMIVYRSSLHSYWAFSTSNVSGSFKRWF